MAYQAETCKFLAAEIGQVMNANRHMDVDDLTIILLIDASDDHPMRRMHFNMNDIRDMNEQLSEIINKYDRGL